MKPFLPFTRPSIDEQSIAAVAEVFRSGQLASGPKVAAFEADLAAYLGGARHVRVMTSATAGPSSGPQGPRLLPGAERNVPPPSVPPEATVLAPPPPRTP